jgi:hypothetical protein
MANTWGLTRNVAVGGRFLVLMTPPGGTPYDVTFFRGAPVKITYSSADPFSDSVAVLNFSQISTFDDALTDPSPLRAILADDAAVDIWWVPSMNVPGAWPAGFAGSNPDTAYWQNALTGMADQVAPTWTYTAPYGSSPNFTYTSTGTRRGTKVWEGFVTSHEVSSSSDGDTLQVQCQGALYQLDSYLAKPFFPPRPQPLEHLIGLEFDRRKRPHLRTDKFRVLWPSDWAMIAPAYDRTQDNAYWPDIKPGSKWTGYLTRQTGSWDHSLTSYIQQMLAVMIVKANSSSNPAAATASRPGNQWTLRMAHENDPNPAGYASANFGAPRLPYLIIRDRFRTPDFNIWAGLPGVEVALTRDATQRADVIYGAGSDFAGTTWNNSIISRDGSRTDYQPLAASATSYPVVNNMRMTKSRIAREQYVQYGTSFSEVQGIQAAEQTLAREIDAGWSGTVTLHTDPVGPNGVVSRWTIQAGMTLRLKGFRGRGNDGLQLHISQVDADVEAGTVNLTVDTRYRDLLTLTEALNRTRDALTPAKLLQLNKNSVAIEDIQMRWSYAKGSGYVPGAYHIGSKHKPTNEIFPYPNWVKSNPPKAKHQWYVPCYANDTKQTGHKGRWGGPSRVRMSEKGTIRRTEAAVFDWHGNLLAIPFVFVLLYTGGECNTNPTIFPSDGNGNYDPLGISNAFEQINPATGIPWTSQNRFGVISKIFCQGWGNKEQPAGYSPGMKTQGGHPTGMLVDESSWDYDCSQNNQNYQGLAKAGQEKIGNISLCAWFYANYIEPVYFQARLYYQAPGSGGSGT